MKIPDTCLTTGSIHIILKRLDFAQPIETFAVLQEVKDCLVSNKRGEVTIPNVNNEGNFNQ